MTEHTLGAHCGWHYLVLLFLVFWPGRYPLLLPGLALGLVESNCIMETIMIRDGLAA